jgi:S1-C subfamily serine protease
MFPWAGLDTIKTNKENSLDPDWVPIQEALTMSDVLLSMSNALAEVVKTVGQGVVRVEARRRMPASGIIWSADGTIVTANHVVKQDEGISIGLADGQAVSARLIGRDPTTDVAVLQAEASGLTVPAQAALDGQTMGVGHFALALGRPGKTVQATLGIISALSEDNWRTPAGGLLDRYLQTDVVMYPGFSGGPLVGVDGQILGLNSSSLLRGISLTVPSSSLSKIVESLVQHGHVRRGYLGVSTQPVRVPDSLKSQVGQETGLLLVAVDESGPGGQGGLLLGDTIVGIDGVTVGSYDDLVTLLTADRVGRAVPIKIIRGGQLEEVSVTIGERP